MPGYVREGEKTQPDLRRSEVERNCVRWEVDGEERNQERRRNDGAGKEVARDFVERNLDVFDHDDIERTLASVVWVILPEYDRAFQSQ